MGMGLEDASLPGGTIILSRHSLMCSKTCSKSHSAPPRSIFLPQPSFLQLSPFQEFRPAFLSFPLPGTLELSLAGDTARPHLAQHPQGSCSHFPGEELNLLPPRGAPGSPDFILCLIIAICCSQLRGCLLPLRLWLSQAHWISLLCGLLAHFPGDAPIPF